jgi:hypothetical protein
VQVFGMRVTMARLGIALAVVGIVLSGLTLHERRVRFLRIAADNAEAVRVITTPGGFVFPRNIIDWHSELQRKYEYAAAHPWLPVAPDLPVPEWPKIVPASAP